MKILLAGCGKMGGALLKGWLAAGISPADILVVEPIGEVPFGVKQVTSPEEVNFNPDIIIMAVKPQMMDQVLPLYKSWAESAVFLSIAAGKTIAYFTKHLGAGAKIVRSMPNTPAALGRGITVACVNSLVSAEMKDICHKLLAAAGQVEWVDDEGLIDAVTAVSGSGPAYVFYLTECLAEAGVKAGLDSELAMKLARATVAGAGEMLHVLSDSPAILRKNVTSPGGTTAAALDVLMHETALKPLMEKTVMAACLRSSELAK